MKKCVLIVFNKKKENIAISIYGSSQSVFNFGYTDILEIN